MRSFKQYVLSLLAASVLILMTLGSPQLSYAESNGCGPVGFGFLIPDGPFSSACDNHDECYGDTGISQAECDRQFQQDMYTICEDRYSGDGVASCQSIADYYYRAVSNSGEMFISLAGRNVSGEIVSVNSRRIDDWWGDDEFEACVTFRNNGAVNTEYDLELYNTNGSFIDREPDTYELNLPIGQTAEECVGTDGIYPSISDLGNTYKIVLRVDAPQQSLLNNLVNDFVSVDWYEGKTP